MAITLGTITLNASRIAPSRNKSLVIHSVPLSNNDKIQNMGLGSKSWEVEIDVVGGNKDTDKATLEGYFTDDTTVSFVYDDTYSVKLQQFEAVEDSTQSRWNITMRLVEIT
jgi:hypothetical protein